MPAIGPYSRAATLSKLDGRSKEGRLTSSLRLELIAHLGGKPSVTQQVLIERACSLQLHCSLLDRKAAEAKGVLTEHDSRTYLAWVASLSRLMRQLGYEAAATPKPAFKGLADLVAAKQ